MDYYGINKDAGGDAGGGGGAAAAAAAAQELQLSNPLDIDGNNFDADMYLERLMTERSLRDLTKKNDSMDKEVRELDSDMKTLVYDNYNKFISATDTIRTMRLNVNNMDGEMKLLRQNIELITAGSSKVNTSLVEKRNRINQLSNVHSLLRKIQFVFELPNRLRKCLELEEYGEAYRFYSRTRDVLKMYQHLPSFTQIHNECEAIMKKVAQRLRVRLTAETTKSSELTECVQILLGLKESPQLLWKEYLKGQRRALSKTLASASNLDALVAKLGRSKGANKGNDAADAEMIRNDPFLRLGNVHDTFLKEFADCVQKFMRLFIALGGTTSMQQHQRALGTIPDISEQDQRAAEDDLGRFVDELSREYFAVVENILEHSGSVSAKAYGLALARLDNDINDFDLRLGLGGRVKLIQRARHVTNQFLLAYAGKLFAVVESSVSSQLARLPARLKSIMANGPPPPSAATSAAAATPGTASSSASGGNASSTASSPVATDAPPSPLSRSEELLMAVQEVVLAIVQSIDTAVGELQAIAQLEDNFIHAHLPAFTQAAFRELVLLWARLDTIILAAAEQPHTGINAVPALTLLLSKASRELESTVIPNVYNRLMEVFANSLRRSSVTHDMTEAVSAFNKLAERLMTRFVELVGIGFTVLIRQFLDTRPWMGGNEPRRVSPLWVQIVNDIGSIEALVEELYTHEDGGGSKPSSESSRSRNRPAPGPAARGGGAGASARATGPVGGAKPAPGYSSNPYGGGGGYGSVDRLFREHIDVYGKVGFSKRAATNALVKITLKALAEGIRLRTLGTFGYQQVQVDVEYLRLHLWSFLSSESTLNTMLDDVLTSAEQRCYDVKAMDRSVVERIAGAASGNELDG